MDVIFLVTSGINNFINKMIIAFDSVGLLLVYKYVTIYATIGSLFNSATVPGNLIIAVEIGYFKCKCILALT